MVSVTSRLTTGVTETAGGGGAPWAAATLHEAAILSAQMAAFQATEAGIEVLRAASLPPRILRFAGMRRRIVARRGSLSAILARGAAVRRARRLGSSIHAGAPQRGDRQKGKPLRGVFLRAQSAVPEDAELALAHGDNLRVVAVGCRLHVCAHHPLPLSASLLQLSAQASRRARDCARRAAGARLAEHSSAAKRSRSASVTVGAEGGARWGHRRGGRARSERGNGNQRGQRQSCDQGFHDGFSMLADRLDISDALLGRRIANTPILSLLNMFWPTS